MHCPSLGATCDVSSCLSLVHSSNKKRTTPLTLLDLPNGVLALIASLIDQQTILRVALACKQLNPIARRSTFFNYDGTANRTGRFLALLEANPQLGPNVRRSAFEPIDRAQPQDFARKASFHLFKSVATLCPNLEELVIHHLPAVGDLATLGTLTMALSLLPKLRILELGSVDASAYPPDEPGRPSWNPPFPADMLLWSLSAMTQLRSLTVVVGGSRSAALLARQASEPGSLALKEVHLILKDPINDDDLVILASRTFPSLAKLSLTVDCNVNITGSGLTEAFKYLPVDTLVHFVMTETGQEHRRTYLDPFFEKPPPLRTLALQATSISPATVTKLPASLSTLVLDVTTARQGRDASSATVSTTLIDRLTDSTDSFLPHLQSLILIGVEQEKLAWTNMAFHMACVKRGVEPIIVPLA